MKGASESRGESEWWCTHVPWDPTRKNSGQKKLVLASGVGAQVRGVEYPSEGEWVPRCSQQTTGQLREIKGGGRYRIKCRHNDSFV